MDKHKKRTVKPNTVRNYTERYHRNIKPVIGEKLLSSVNTIHCQTIMNKMVGLKWSDVDLEKRTLTGSRSMEYRHSVGERRIGTPKTSKIFNACSMSIQQKNKNTKI